MILFISYVGQYIDCIADKLMFSDKYIFQTIRRMFLYIRYHAGCNIKNKKSRLKNRRMEFYWNKKYTGYFYLFFM